MRSPLRSSILPAMKRPSSLALRWPWTAVTQPASAWIRQRERGSWAVPVERDVLARARRPLELVAEGIHGADGRLAPRDELTAGARLATRRVRELRILSRQARRPRQRLCPGLHFSRNL